ncbi:MAG TPA: acetoacetate--CoA ligase [Frankiaceae bacterium]|nr:acetoacetate--CoA ligase [Frankiaceae bacterium]
MTRRIDRMPVPEGRLLWEPSQERRRAAQVTRYLAWLREHRGLAFADPGELWRWSVEDLDGFWSSIWEFFGVRGRRGDGPVLAERRMPGARWFPGATLNYAEQALARTGDGPAIVAVREDGASTTSSWDELRGAVGRAAAGLRRLGVGPGDRVCAVLPNSPHAVIAFLATASIGAVWSSCSPDFGPTSLADRFTQVEPTVLLGVDGYLYNGRRQATLDTLAALERRLPSVRATVVVAYLDAAPDTGGLRNAVSWDALLAGPQAANLGVTRVPFDAPLWILYSSGTTGLPKPIVHGHGGITLELLKVVGLHTDVGPGDRLFWFTTTGWMMWNFLVSGLLVGATIVLYDGSPAHPDLGALWRLAGRTGITCFGTSAPYLASCMSADLVPSAIADLSRIRTVGSTGAPLPPEGFAWVYDAVAPDLLLASVSGGTDVCTAFVAGLPLLPVHAGEIQTRGLGCAVAAFDDDAQPVVDRVGELVVTEPMPSMPLFFWGDEDGSRLRESYFSTYPGVWRHGDWVKITSRGSVVIYGRSDSTLNRGGVRIGTAEFYRVVDDVPEVTDSLVIDTSSLGNEGELRLFVVLREGAELSDELRGRIRGLLRRELSPRHVPDRIEAIPQVPRTLNGKKLEVPVKRLLRGDPLEQAVSLGAVANPEALRVFVPASGRT